MLAGKTTVYLCVHAFIQIRGIESVHGFNQKVPEDREATNRSEIAAKMPSSVQMGLSAYPFGFPQREEDDWG